MDNNNNNRLDSSLEELFSNDNTDGGYTYERERTAHNRQSAMRREKERRNKTKKTALLISVALLLAILWIVAAFAIVRAVFNTDAPIDDPADTTQNGGIGGEDTTGGEQGGDEKPGGMQFITVSMGADDYKSGVLILINSEHKYDQKGDTMLKSQLVDVSAYSNGTYIVASSKPVQLRMDTVRALNAMFSDFKAETGLSGYRLSDDYGYITTEDQAYWFGRYEQKHGENAHKYEFRGGESEHEAGRTFDIKVFEGETKFIANASKEYAWIYDNCYKYGIIDRYPADKKDKTGVDMKEGETLHCDHFRYVGVAAATAMHNNNWCLEEFLEAVKGYTYDSEHLGVEGIDGTKYEMYYYPATEGAATDVKVPDGLTYEISGDNKSGYIVTVTIDK